MCTFVGITLPHIKVVTVAVVFDIKLISACECVAPTSVHCQMDNLSIRKCCIAEGRQLGCLLRAVRALSDDSGSLPGNRRG